ncbi:MAG: helix-turn-helix domain-containing protein, partial [Candidatus Latescibacteria bacterium]|nr:helix-turn-helix domain-containing protein [Candidatus Latescibacterota bacterium]
ITTAQDGREALALLESEPIDVAVLDLKMPHLDGLQICDAVQLQELDLDIVVLTGYGTVETAVRALKMGANDFLEKPVEKTLFLTTLQNLIARRYPSSHVLADQLDRLLQERCTLQSFRLSDLCALLKISTRYASQLFRQHLKTTFRQRLAHYRVQHAKKLLNTSDDPLYLIAEQCGYKNYQRLGEAFKRLEGVSPGQYRKISAARRSAYR